MKSDAEQIAMHFTTLINSNQIIKARSYRGSSGAVSRVFYAIISLCLILGQVRSLASHSLAGQKMDNSQALSLGILDFQNESSLNLRPELCLKVAQELRQKIILTSKNVLPRAISAGSDLSIKMMTLEQLTTLGKGYGVKYVVRGGLLGLTREGEGERAIFRAQLYSEIISVESASIKTFRSEGVGAQEDASASAGVKGSVFGNSAQERALSNAVEELASAILQAITEAPTTVKVEDC
ncbi:MAG TPA: hypothetical protein VIG62_16365 [Blastocatellia bacterium]